MASVPNIVSAIKRKLPKHVKVKISIPDGDPKAGFPTVDLMFTNNETNQRFVLQHADILYYMNKNPTPAKAAKEIVDRILYATGEVNESGLALTMEAKQRKTAASDAVKARKVEKVKQLIEQRGLEAVLVMIIDGQIKFKD